MKRFLSVLLVLCISASLGIFTTSVTAEAVSHVQNDRGLGFDRYVAKNKRYSSEYYESEKHLEEVPLSFEAWFFLPSSLGGTNAGTIIGNHSSKSGGKFIFGIEEDYRPYIYFCNKSSATHSITFGENAELTVNKWVHLVITYDEVKREFNCYVNGELKETLPLSSACSSECENGCGGVFDLESAAQFPFVLGGDLNYLNPQYFKGYLQDVAIYSDTLSKEEVYASYKNGVNAEDDDLILYYDLNSKDKGKDISDESGNGYNMKFNTVWLTEEEMQAIRDTNSSEKNYDYAIAVIGDPQYATRLYPKTVRTMYQWLADNKESKNIQYVIGLGDLTDQCQGSEWTEATDALKILENANLEYTFVRGNHDKGQSIETEYKPTIAPELYDALFANNQFYTNQFKENGGFYEEGSVVNVYRTLTLGDDNWLIIALDFKADEAVRAWACNVLESHPDHRAIIVTHEYLGASGDPTSYGKSLWNDVASKYANVEMVLSGHISWDDININQAQGINGNTVTQMLIDPQRIDYNLGGVGLVAMFYFRENGEIIDIEYFSTVKKSYFKNKNQFSINLSAKVNAPIVKWNGESYAIPDGDGTAKSPFLISSAENLMWLSLQFTNSGMYDTTGKYFLQTCDIDLNKHSLPPIGTLNTPFDGCYNGNGFRIFNGMLGSSESIEAGLFGVIKSATVKNVSLHNISVHGCGELGAIVGKAISEPLGTTNLIEKCYISNTTSLKSLLKTDGSSVGGIAGDATNTHIVNCETEAIIYVNGSNYVGGAVGCANDNSIISDTKTDCIFIFTDQTCDTFVGGCAGKIGDRVTLYDLECRTNIEVITDSFSTTPSIGGVVGFVNISSHQTTYVIGCSSFISFRTDNSASLFSVYGTVNKLNSQNCSLVISDCKSYTEKDSFDSKLYTSAIEGNHEFKPPKKDANDHKIHCECGCDITIHLPHSYSENGFCNGCEANINGVSLGLSDTLSLTFYISISDELLSNRSPKLSVNIGDSTIVIDEYKEENGEYVFKLKGIPLVSVVDYINADLYIEGDGTNMVVAQIVDFSIREYCIGILERYQNDATICSVAGTLLTLSADLQNISNYKTDKFADGGLAFTSSEVIPSEEHQASIEGNENSDCYIKTQQIIFDSSISFGFNIHVEDVNAMEVLVDGNHVDISSLEQISANVFVLKVKLSNILIKDLKVTVELKYNGETTARLTYDIYSHAYYGMVSLSDSDAQKGLALSLYRYVCAVDNYVTVYGKESEK